MTYVGGTRTRLIHNSLYKHVQAGLTAIGWFDSGRQHKPVNLIPEFKGWDEELAPNTITVSPGNMSADDWELGSFGTEQSLPYYIDVYGEKESLGEQLAGDIVALLQGKFASLGYPYPVVPVLDYTQATPTQIFYCPVESVRADRAQTYAKRWQRYLWQVSVTLTDYVGGDEVGEFLVN